MKNYRIYKKKNNDNFIFKTDCIENDICGIFFNNSLNMAIIVSHTLHCLHMVRQLLVTIGK